MSSSLSSSPHASLDRPSERRRASVSASATTFGSQRKLLCGRNRATAEFNLLHKFSCITQTVFISIANTLSSFACIKRRSHRRSPSQSGRLRLAASAARLCHSPQRAHQGRTSEDLNIASTTPATATTATTSASENTPSANSGGTRRRCAAAPLTSR